MSANLPSDVVDLIEREVTASIQWLWDYATADPSAPGFGQVLDRDDEPEISSIAATGFGLAAWCLGVERGQLAKDEVIIRARGALNALLNTASYAGWLAHFVNAQTGEAKPGAEYSTADTILAVNGALVAASYLNDPEITDLTDRLVQRLNYSPLLTENDGALQLKMAHTSAANGDYADGAAPSWVGRWDMTAEQLPLYIIAAGKPDVSRVTANRLWEGFSRPIGEYGGHKCVYEWGGTLFVYHFPHCFWPIGKDRLGLDWWHNAQEATKANARWCWDNRKTSKTFAAGLWGPSACLGPHGYTVDGAEPARPPSPHYSGTIPPASLIAGAAFAPAEAARALRVLRDEFLAAWDERYGFTDAINLDGYGPSGGPWYANTRFGLNKGQSALLGAAALGDSTVWDAYQRNPWVACGIEVLGLTRAELTRA